jgi:hypothetical protein
MTETGKYPGVRAFLGKPVFLRSRFFTGPGKLSVCELKVTFIPDS